MYKQTIISKLAQMRKGGAALIAFLLLFCTVTVFAQNFTVTGTVTDANGEPLIGTNILVKGTTNGTATDINGKFTINSVSAQSVLVVGYVGFISQEITVGNQRTFNIRLIEDTQHLDEVVVVGYGTQVKRDITASVAVVDMKNLKKTSGSSATQQLQGKVSGVYIGNSGAAGGATMVRIRGINTINDNGPLYVIDGVSSRNQDLSTINPNDIETIQILKDASAAAIYGAQASNGVVLITTKQGSKTGQPVLTYDGYYGVQNPGKRYDVLNSKDRMDLEYLGKLNAAKLAGTYDPNNSKTWPQHSLFKTTASGFEPYPYLTNKGGSDNVNDSDYDFPNFMYMPYSDTNWWDAVTHENAPIQSHQLGLSGGTDKGQYNASLGYFDQQSVHKYRYYKRYSTRLNSTFNIRPWLRLGENFSFMWSKDLGRVNDGSEGSIYSWTYRTVPWVPVYDAHGNFAGSTVPDTGNWQNPVAILTREKDNYWSNLRAMGNVYAEIDLMKGLTFKTLFGVDYTNAYHYRMNKKNLEFSESGKQNDFEEGASFNFRLQWSNTLTYRTTINDVHKLGVMLGTEYIKDNLGRGMTAQRFNYLFEDNPNTWTLPMGDRNDQREENSWYKGEFALFGIFGRVDYSFMDKYLLTVNMRRDGVSRFSAANRYGTFPSVSVGWRISEEKFMAPTRTWLDDLKLRAGYGLVGNSDVPRTTNFAYEYIMQPQRANYDIAGGNGGSSYVGFRLDKFGNENTKWEAVKNYNVGIDMTVLNGKFSINAEYYQKTTSDMLIKAAYTGMAGEAEAPYINIGSVKNTGYDISLNYRDGKGDFNWDIALNLSHYKNEVIKLSDSPDYAIFEGGTRLDGDVNRTIAGRPMSEFYGYKVNGFYESIADVKACLPVGVDPTVPLKDAEAAKWIGKFKYQDTDGSGNLTSNDRVPIGSPHPDIYGGLNIGLNYKNWDFTMFWYGSYGNKIFNNTALFTDFQVFRGNRSSRMRDLSWEPGKTNAVLPIIDANDTYGQKTSSYFVEDGSYMRMKNLMLGYTIPKDLLRKLTISNLRVYAQVENSLTLTKYRGIDPEVTNVDVGQGSGADLRKGLDMGSWPNIIRVIFGVNFAF